MTDPILPVRVDRDEREEWAEYAASKEMSVSELVRVAVRAEIDGKTAAARLREQVRMLTQRLLVLKHGWLSVRAALEAESLAVEDFDPSKETWREWAERRERSWKK